MKLLIQRVHTATITIDHDEKRTIQQGLVVYLGVSNQALIETQAKIDKAVERILNIPVFEDDAGRLKLSLQAVQGDLLIVSNFTLHGRNKKGNQIDYTDSASFKEAQIVYDQFLQTLQQQYDKSHIKTGAFGTYMQIDASVDGPVNLVIDI